MKKAIIIALALLPILAFGQGTTGDKSAAKTPIIVSVTARATDVRAIIADLFGQAKLNYVLQPGAQAALFLSLDKVEFEEALNIICAQSKLTFEVQNGIYFISKAKPPVVVAPAIPKGMLDKSVLTHKLTTKLMKTEIRAVFAEFGKQTDVTIDVDKSVPAFKLDAILHNASLKYALEKVTDATGLKYRFTDNLSILIYKPETSDKVAISGG